MKSKQYAARITANLTDNDLTADVLVDLMQELITATAIPGKSTESIAGCIREGFSKWKSIVGLVQKFAPDYPIAIGYYLKALAAANPAMYWFAVQRNVFLGYALDAYDEAAALNSRTKIENEVLREHLARLEREARRLGIKMA